MPQRILQPEILDTLSPEHPDAIHNRRDLRITNHIVGNYRWTARTLARHLRPGERVLEIGAGDGELGRRLAARGLAVDGLDLWPRPKDWPAAQAWHIGDLRAFENYEDYPVVLGNFILHQFTDAELLALGKTWQRRCRLILACEPARRRRSQWLFRAVAPLLGANHVTMHDAHASIASGFVGDELPRMLGLDPSAWDCSCRVTTLGAYRLIAVRRS